MYDTRALSNLIGERVCVCVDIFCVDAELPCNKGGHLKCTLLLYIT